MHNIRPIFCHKHSSSVTTPVCQHIEDSIQLGQPIEIVPIFYEEYLFEIYYKKFWICNSCALENEIPLNGILLFNSVMRQFANLTEEEQDSFMIEDVKTTDPFESIKNNCKAVCKLCFEELYSETIKSKTSDLSILKHIAIDHI